MDIFDAGPILKANRNDLRSWNNCQLARVTVTNDISDEAEKFMITNNRLDFRATIANAIVKEPDSLLIPELTAEMLQVGNMDRVQYLSIS